MDPARTGGRTAQIGSGLSTVTQGKLATDTAFDQAAEGLGGATADLVVLFVAPQFEDELPQIVDIEDERQLEGRIGRNGLSTELGLVVTVRLEHPNRGFTITDLQHKNADRRADAWSLAKANSTRHPDGTKGDSVPF